MGFFDPFGNFFGNEDDPKTSFGNDYARHDDDCDNGDCDGDGN